MSDWWSRTTDADHSDAWRWSRAEREAERNPAPDLRPVFRRFVLVQVPGLLVLGVSVSVVVAWVRGVDRMGTGLGLAARWGLLAATAGLLAFGVVHLVRSLREASNVLGVMSPGQRTRVRRQLRGIVPVAPHELKVLRAAARDRQAGILRSTFTLIPLGSLNLVQLANPRNDVVIVVLECLIVLVLVAAVVVGWWQYRQASAFLRCHPERDLSRIDDPGE